MEDKELIEEMASTYLNAISSLRREHPEEDVCHYAMQAVLDMLKKSGHAN